MLDPRFCTPLGSKRTASLPAFKIAHTAFARRSLGPLISISASFHISDFLGQHQTRLTTLDHGLSIISAAAHSAAYTSKSDA
jgi:hypothetical protein